MGDFEFDYSYQDLASLSPSTDESDNDDSRSYNRDSKRTAPAIKKTKLEKNLKSKKLSNYPSEIDKSNVSKVAKHLLKDREYLMDLPGNNMDLLFTTKTMLDVIEMFEQKCKDLKAENKMLDTVLEESEKRLKMLSKRNSSKKLEIRVERLESAVFGKVNERNIAPEQKKYENLHNDNCNLPKADISLNYGTYEHSNKSKNLREPTIQDTSTMNNSRRRNVDKSQKSNESLRFERLIIPEKPTDDTVCDIIDDSVHLSDLQNNSDFVQTFVLSKKLVGDNTRQQVEKSVKLNDLQNKRDVSSYYVAEKTKERVSIRQKLPVLKERIDNTFDKVFRHPSTSVSSFANSSTSQASSFRFPHTPPAQSDSSARVSLPLTPYPGLNPLNFSSPSLSKSRNDSTNK